MLVYSRHFHHAISMALTETRSVSPLCAEALSFITVPPIEHGGSEVLVIVIDGGVPAVFTSAHRTRSRI